MLTLGGLRPGSIYCIVPGRPQLEWKPCLTRDESKAGPHVWHLASTDETSLYCPGCRPHDPQAFAELAETVRSAVASGNHAAAAAVFSDHPFARMLLRVSTRRLSPVRPASSSGVLTRDYCCPRIVLGLGLHSPTCKNAPKADDAAELGRDVAGTPSAMGGRADAQTSRQTKAPAEGESTGATSATPRTEGTQPTTMPAIPRDDPKAEAGSFERYAPWRPKYRDRADWDEWRRERAAICEYLGGMRRGDAERFANQLAGAPP